MTPRVKIAIEQIARMRVAGIRDGVIAVKIGMSQAGLSRILALPEYQDFEAAVLSGLTSKMDDALAGKVKDMEAYFERTVPVALRTLFEACVQRRDLRVAMSAASEILDRDPKGTFSTKRVGLDSNAQTSVSPELLASLEKEADKTAQQAAKDQGVATTVIQ